MGVQRSLELLCCIGLICLIFNTDIIARAETHAKRATSARVTSSRSFGTNVKHSSSSNGLNFDCPEEFGYYPHPTDCSQYYVCVFGGALLESCTGGLMYSHELQTCDWPRNVGCEVVDSGPSASNSNAQRDGSGRSLKQQSVPNQHVPSRVRFGSAFTSPAATSTSTSSHEQPKPTVPQQYHRQPPQTIQAQVQTIPPPPELKVPPNPVITSRGQPKPLLDSREDIAKLYADAHDTLPPVEEEETDRQQRVYRGQPSTVSQVQRDRDGIIHQASLNAIPNHGKIGSFAFGSQYSPNSIDVDSFDKHHVKQLKTFERNSDKISHRRGKRDLTDSPTSTLSTPSTNVISTSTLKTKDTTTKDNSNSVSESTSQSEIIITTTTTTTTPATTITDKVFQQPNYMKNMTKTSPKPDFTSTSQSSIDSNTSSEIVDEVYSIETGEDDSNTAKELLDLEGTDLDDALPSESVRSPRQLRAFGRARARWPSHTNTNYRSIDSHPYQQQPSYVLGPYNPYLTPPPSKSGFSQLSPGYQPYQTFQQQPNYQPQHQKPQTIYTRYNIKLPSAPIEDDFRPIAGNYYQSSTTTTTVRPNYFKNPDLLPYLLQSLKDYKELRKKQQQQQQQQQTDSFSYFHLENQPVSTSPKPIPHVHATEAPLPQYQQQHQPQQQQPHYHHHHHHHEQQSQYQQQPHLQQQAQHYQPSKPQVQPQPQKVTPNSHYASYSTVGGFYNNQGASQYQANTEATIQLEFKPTVSTGKLVSQYSISDSHTPSTTTEGNYFQYNILTNQKMKPFYSANTPSFKDSAQNKQTTQPSPTSNINIIAAPNLATARPIHLSDIPIGITYANGTSQHQYGHYQALTKVTTSAPSPQKLRPVSTTLPFLKPQINLQFNIPEFVASLKASDLTNINPTVTNMLKFFKQIGTEQMQITPFQQSQNSPSSPTTTEDYDEEVFESTTERTRLNVKKPTPTLPKPISTTTAQTTKRPIKGYESFFNSISNKYSTTPGSTNRYTTQHNFLNQGEEYYDEYDENGSDSDDEILPPSEMPPYMPMSETMAPTRPQMPTPNPPAPSNTFNHKPSYMTGYFEATTTRRPFISGINIQQTKNTSSHVPPPFIQFPTDIFQEIKQRFPLLLDSTTKFWTAPPTPTPTPPPPSKHFATTIQTTTPKTTTTITTTTLRTRYTVRPNRNRGQSKWQEYNNKVNALKNQYLKLNQNNNKSDTNSQGYRKRPNAAAIKAEFGVNANKVNSDMDSYRIESSTSSSSSSLQSHQTPTAASLFVQPPSRPTKIIIETIPSSGNNNRNYYNTSSPTKIKTNAYNHVGYEPQLHHNHNHNQQQQQQSHQGQQQTISLQNRQQSDLSVQQPEQGSYETYYSVYDDDIDLYRDIEYQQQQQQQQQQQSPQQQQQVRPPQQYQAQQPIRQQQQQSTYRPLEILATPTPAQQVPLRETSYINNNNNKPIPVPVEKPTYTNQQALIYNTDYDEDLLAQIEQDNAYEQPTRSPIRAEQVTIRTLHSAFQSSPTSTPRPDILYNDARHYYKTLTTEEPTTTQVSKVEDPTSYSYDTSVEYNEAEDYPSTERPFYQQPTRFTTYAPKLISTQQSEEYSVIDDSTTYSKETTKAVDFTTKFVRPTTSKATSKPSRFVSTSGSGSSYTRPTAHSTAAATSRRTIPSTTVQTTTPKSTTQFLRTTSAPTTTTTSTSTSTTTRASRSKTHANKSHKNQPQKSRAKNPTATTTATTTTTTTSTTITTPTPTSTPTSTPTLAPTSAKQTPKFTTTQAIQSYPHASTSNTIVSIVSPIKETLTTPKTQSLISVVAQTQSHSKRVDITVAPARSSLQSLEDVENISDESRKVHIKSSESSNRFNNFEIVEPQVYATSPRGNLVRSNTEKPYRGSVYYDDFNGKNSGEYHSKSAAEKSSKFTEQQRKRIQSFVLSDIEPRSFKPPPTPRSTTPIQHDLSTAAVNGDSASSTTTLRYSTLSGVESPQPFKYSLESGSNGFSLRVQNHPLAPSTGSAETLKPIYERRVTTTPIYSTPTTTTTTTAAPAQMTTSKHSPKATPNSEVIYPELRIDDIKPTTYAPPLRNWRNGRTTNPTSSLSSSQQSEYDDHVSSSGSEHNIVTAEKASSSYSSTTPRQITPTAFTPTTERTVQSFTARASHFKDNLIKTTGSPALRFVSPYKSLETILQETGRTTIKPRYTNPTVSGSPILQTTSKPRGTYFLITTPPRNLSDSLLAGTMSGSLRNFSISDTILSTFSTITSRPPTPFTTSTPPTTTTTTTTPRATELSSTVRTTPSSAATVIVTAPLRVAPTAKPEPRATSYEDFSSSENSHARGRSRYTAVTAASNLLDDDEPTTYSPKFRAFDRKSPPPGRSYRRKIQRARISALQRQRNEFPSKAHEKFQVYRSSSEEGNDKSVYFQPKSKNINRKPVENESVDNGPRAEALVALPLDSKIDNSIESSRVADSPDSYSSTEHVVAITDRPLKYFFSNKYRQQTAEHTLAESLQNAGYITSSTGRSTKYHPTSVLEQLQLFLAGDSDESSAQHFVNDFSQPEIKAAVQEIKNLYAPSATTSTISPPTTTTTTTLRTTTTGTPPPTLPYVSSTTTSPLTYRYTTTVYAPTPPTLYNTPTTPSTSTTQFFPKFPNNQSPSISTTTLLSIPNPSPTPPTGVAAPVIGIPFGRSTSNVVSKTPNPIPMRASRVNNAIKSSIAAAATAASSAAATAARGNKVGAFSATSPNGAAAVKCSDSTSNAKCNEIPSRTNSNTRNRGSSHYPNQDRDLPAAPINNNRGTHPPRTRPTLKPSGTIVSKAQEFVDIYRYPPTRPEPLYPQPTPDKAAAKCRRDVCLLPDCSCGGRDIPGGLSVQETPQTVLITFDDAVSELNIYLYQELFNNETRRNPNGCPQRATYYVSHEWTDYGMIQDLYADGHEMASHTVSHSFGEQFSQKKWTREVAGQREILAAYGGVKLSDVRGMRAPFLSVGGNKMYKMLYDSNFTYDSSMPVYENRPPSWPYTLDYKIFHDCMIPPCPTRSYPGVWQVPMVMWQDLNGGRCSMGDACSNPSDADGVYKMIMKNFERHYTTNRAPFGLFYHAAWFTQPHHKEGFIKFLDAINAMPDVWIVTNWQMLQWVRDPTPISRINSFQPFQCDYSDRPKRCNNPKVCNLWHKSGVRYMKTCQPCPDIYPWTGKTGIRSSRIDNDIEDSTA